MYRMIELKNDEKSRTICKSLTLLTLLIESCVIAVEDIGVANISLSISVVDYFSTNYKSGEYEPPIGEVLYIIEKMCESKKTRLMSHVKNIYFNEKCSDYARNKWDFKKDEGFSDEINKFISKHDSNESKTIKKLSLAFYYRLKERDYNAVYWLGRYITDLQDDSKSKSMFDVNTMVELVNKRQTFIRNGKVSYLKGSNPIVVLWDYISKLFDKDAINILRIFYFNNIVKGDTLAFMMLAICAIVENVSYKHINFEGKTISSKEISKLLRADYDLEIDEDYVHDKHTKGGKGGTVYFRQVSSHVENEDLAFRNEIFYDTYMNCYP